MLGGNRKTKEYIETKSGARIWVPKVEGENYSFLLGLNIEHYLIVVIMIMLLPVQRTFSMFVVLFYHVVVAW